MGNIIADTIRQLRIVRFRDVTEVTASSGAVSIPLDTAAKIRVLLNNEATVTATFKTPLSPCNFTVEVVHGGTTASTVTFATEGSESIIEVGPSLDVSGSPGDVFILTCYYNGSDLYVSCGATSAY